MQTFRLDQKGFTLIELLVVVAIIAIMLSVVTLSVSSSGDSKLRKQTAAMKGVLIALCDRAAFDQRPYLAMPKPEGLEFARLVKRDWQAAERLTPALWEAGVEVAWELDQDAAKQRGLPAVGWVCWPSGELSAGEMVFSLDKRSVRLSWDALGRTKTEDLFAE